jgi:chromosome segregation ATPase
MSDSPNRAALNLVIDEGSDPSEVDESLNKIHQPVAASEERIADLERKLGEAADQEAETAQILDSERQRRAALDQQLHQAREEAARLILDEASQTRSAIRAEAEELLQATRVEAERESGQATKRAFNEANEMIAMARREAVAIVDAGREQVRALEDDSAQRMAELDTEHQELTHRLGIMETTYDELLATLKLVAETSIGDLVNKQDSLKQLDRVETHGQSNEPSSEQTTSSSPPQESLPTDLEAASASAGDEPASIEIPPITGNQRTQAHPQTLKNRP